MTVRCLIHARQSETRGAGADSRSLDAYESELRAWAEREGWVVVGVIREADLRGWQDETQRPAVREILARAETGEFDVLAEWELSRLARSVRLQETWVWQLARFGVEVRSLTEPHAADAMLRQIMGAVHERRTREISQHATRIIHERARQGRPHSRAPFALVRSSKGGPFVPDPDHSERVEIIRNIFLRFSGGDALHAICADLTDRGIPTPLGHAAWRPGTVVKMLRNPSYRGAVRVKNTVVEGAHEALVEPELWRRVQARLDAKLRGPRRLVPLSWLEGMVRHGCGASMTLVAYAKRPQPARPAFRCAATPRRPDESWCAVRPLTMAAWKLESAVAGMLVRDLSTLLPVASVVDATMREFRSREPLAGRARRKAEDRLSRAAGRRERAEDLYLSGSRDRAWFDAEDARCSEEVRSAEATIAALPAAPNPAEIEATAGLLRETAERLAELDADGLRAAARRLGLVATVDAGGVRVRYRPEIQAHLSSRRFSDVWLT